MTPRNFILGYTLPLLPIAILEGAVTYIVALILGLKLNINLILSIILIIPIALLYIGIGLLCGSILGVKQVGGICGALLTNLSAWLSGVWFDLHLVGGFFEKIAEALPFFHAVEMEKALFQGDFQLARTHVLPVLLYSVSVTALAVLFFLKQMKKQ